MERFIRIGMDTSKSSSSCMASMRPNSRMLRKKLRRNQVLAFFARLSPMRDRAWKPAVRRITGRANCAAWAMRCCCCHRNYVKPYVKRSKIGCGRCRGDLRGDEPAGHAFRTGQNCRQPSSTDVCEAARTVHRPAHAACQFAAWFCGGVRPCRTQGAFPARRSAGRHPCRCDNPGPGCGRCSRRWRATMPGSTKRSPCSMNNFWRFTGRTN